MVPLYCRGASAPVGRQEQRARAEAKVNGLPEIAVVILGGAAASLGEGRGR